MTKVHDEDEHEHGNQPDPFTEFVLETYQALLEDRTILFNSDVKENVIEKVVLPLMALSKKNRKPIKILINSSGGDIESGQMVVDAILTSRCEIEGVAMGKAMSAAFDIFLACDKRTVYPNTILMAHSGSAALASQTLSAIKVEGKLLEVYFQRWASFYASRTKISEKEWLSLLSSGLNRYFFPEEAIETGIAHEIVSLPKKITMRKRLSK